MRELFLSQLKLNPFSSRSLRLASNPEDIKALLTRVFDGPRHQSGALFRVDESPYGPNLLIQSWVQPDLQRFDLKAADLRDEPATKPLILNLQPGQELCFRLAARPSKSAPATVRDERGKRSDIRDDDERLAWLNRQGERSGFRVLSCGITILSQQKVKSDINPRDRCANFSAVRFDGEMVIIEPSALTEAMEQGIGRQKAFGFGLLSLGRTA